MATVVIGGLITSTVLTLLVVPVVFSLIEGLRDRVHRSRPGNAARDDRRQLAAAVSRALTHARVRRAFRSVNSRPPW